MSSGLCHLPRCKAAPTETVDEAIGQVVRLWALTLLEGSSSHGKMGMLQSTLSVCWMIHDILCLQTLNSCGPQQLLQH